MEKRAGYLTWFVKLVKSKYVGFIIVDRKILGEVRSENVLKSSELESQDDKIEDLKAYIRELER